jgi:phosphopantothenoylcysteine decarboxylase/phosphopantothenate--cysteine ligase
MQNKEAIVKEEISIGTKILKGKSVILGVTGSIAAYKIADLASMLVKSGCDVFVIMTENATNFINPITFETLTGNKCLVDTFDRNFKYSVEHISLAKKADLFLVAPASANIIGKMANGIADDMLSTTILACTCKKIISPAMNTNMYKNIIVQDNIKKLENYGMEVIKPDSGYLACGDIGEGKMPSAAVLFDYILKELQCEKDLAGKNVLITAGPTIEKIDKVRFISNPSSGKMGYEIARAAMLRGASVTLISGKTSLTPPPFVKVINVLSAEDMFEAVKENYKEANIIIKSAAVADYRPSNPLDYKVKKTDGELFIELERTEDILKYLGENKEKNQFLCGFSMETDNMIENSEKKLYNKALDMIVANNLRDESAGFEVDTNLVTIITKKEKSVLPLMTKKEVAHRIFDFILKED